MPDDSIRHRLGRLDTYSVQFGVFTIHVKPDRTGDKPALFLLQITGPGLPDLHIAEDGARPLPEGDTGHWGDGNGVIVFGGYGTEKLRIPFPGKWPMPDPCAEVERTEAS
jgi:hypothetical protein